METFGNEKVAKSGKIDATKYRCEKCDYKCSKKYNWDKHLETDKHKKHDVEMSSGKKWQNNMCKFECEICNRLFATTSGLWKHKQKCNSEKNNNKDELIEYLMKENKEIKELILELAKKDT